MPYAIQKSPELRNYLKYVNHYRDEDFREVDIKRTSSGNNMLSPLNKDDFSYFIYSRFSNCNIERSRKDRQNCNTILMQGDSIGEGLGSIATDLIFRNFSNRGWQTINGSSSSFSPKNNSAQLAYMYSKGIKPKVVISIIDQGDLGDDFIRYKNQSKYSYSNIRHYKVKPFQSSHLRFYNYSVDLDPPNAFRIKPVTPVLITSIIRRFAGQLFYYSDTKYDFTSTPGWSSIVKPLMKKNQEADNYFAKVLKNYIKTAADVGAEELYFISFPHPRNIVQNIAPNRKYIFSVSTIIDQVVANNKDFPEGIKVNHLEIEVDQRKYPCTDETCSGFYEENDHHPTANGYKTIAKQIKKYLSYNSKYAKD